MSMPHALMSSGGKDSTLALDRARRQGMDVRFFANLYDHETRRVRFHGVRHDLIAEQARALELELVSAPTKPEQFEQSFLGILQELKNRGAHGVVFGNIHLADVRAWYEDRVIAAGLEHVEPIWGEDPAALARETVERGYKSIVVSVDLAQGASVALGRAFDTALVHELSRLRGVDACGEKGEFHSFVYDGPEFTEPVQFERGETVEMEGHKLLDLIPVTTAPSQRRSA